MEIVRKEQSDLSLQQPKKFYAELQVRKMSDVAESQSPPLSVITKNHGFNVTKSILIIALVDLIDFFNVQNNFTDGQIKTTAELVMDKFYWFKPEDFKLCFTKAKTGEYGVTYNRLDGGVIFEWLNRYEEERENYFATLRSKGNYAPAIRTSEVTQIHALYDKVVQESANAEIRRKRIEELKTEARERWNYEYEQHFEHNELTEQTHKEYIGKYPLSSSYIDFYVKKHL